MNKQPICNEYSNGCKSWFLNDKLHREDGPAIEWADGYKQWYRYGKCHRDDGPAIEYPNGHKEWYADGIWHREDGPAIEWPDGRSDWFLHGEKYSLSEWNDITSYYSDEEIVLMKLRDE